MAYDQELADDIDRLLVVRDSDSAFEMAFNSCELLYDDRLGWRITGDAASMGTKAVDKDRAEFHQALKVFNLIRKEGKTPEEALQEAGITPEHVDYTRYLGFLYFREGASDMLSGNSNGAYQAYFLKAAKLNANIAELHFQVGILDEISMKHDDAIARYNRALEIDPYHKDAMHLLGDAHVKAGRIEEAKKAFEQAIKLGSKRAERSLEKLLKEESE